MLVAGTHTWVLCKSSQCQLLTAEPSLQMPNFYNNFHLHNFPDKKAHETTSLDANTCCQEPVSSTEERTKAIYLIHAAWVFWTGGRNHWPPELTVSSQWDHLLGMKLVPRATLLPLSPLFLPEPIPSDGECSFLGKHGKHAVIRALGAGVLSGTFFTPDVGSIQQKLEYLLAVWNHS